ncbi:MAG: polysaccharide biosynthesis/export family protein [Pyrinomonadaceae bacterium]
MKRISSSILPLALVIVFALVGNAQEGTTPPPSTPPSVPSDTGSLDMMGVRGYLLGPGDILAIKVFGEPQLDTELEVRDDGNIEFPFVETPIVAKCRTDHAVRDDIVIGLAKFIRNPQVSVRIKERRSRPPAVVFGAVRVPQRIQMQRRVRLLDILAFSGGVVKDQAGNTVMVKHTEPLLCSEGGPEPAPNTVATISEDDFSAYDLDDLAAGRPEANPYVNPGDIVIVPEAPPIYITGSVLSPQGVRLREHLSLTQALAMVGGVRKEAKKREVTIRRLKPNSSDRETIVVNFEAIQKQQQKDIELQAYDIVEVGEASAFSKERIGQTMLGLATGGLSSGIGSAFSTLPVRVLY